MSPVTLKLDHPDFPDDYEFGVGELGRVKNHGTLEVSDEDAQAFEDSRGMNLADAFVHNSVVTVSGQELSQEKVQELQEQEKQRDAQQQQEEQPAEPSAPSVPTEQQPANEGGEQ